ncbi:GNAT family N-acetyltransferase [Meridianimaribacter flavus]|uniref:RimJ/RimL family protein N-acetyltransferase n=1 Tax=Meridianimaribacter flavus TaxID=571115 RepID=A0ABY2G7L9_9FLAO|nr:GNAT family protein [Meridianimaribacter flavus]TDY12519.1 RimJ/RimL family protein N-acetyltransferase [Meridianimaribacter flavus]
MNIPPIENDRVSLTLLGLSNYKKLQDIANEKDLIAYSPSDISSPEKLKSYVQTAVDGFYHKTIIPFIIYDKQKQKFTGSTRFGHINWDNKTLHIGWTWIGREFQGSGLNTNMKFLMLQYAFETLAFEKVEFRIDERNIRSRKAVEKLGATLEGILRRDVVLKDGFRRNTCCYGILKDEWPTIKQTIFKEFN